MSWQKLMQIIRNRMVFCLWGTLKPRYNLNSLKLTSSSVWLRGLFVNTRNNSFKFNIFFCSYEPNKQCGRWLSYESNSWSTHDVGQFQWLDWYQTSRRATNGAEKNKRGGLPGISAKVMLITVACKWEIWNHDLAISVNHSLSALFSYI